MNVWVVIGVLIGLAIPVFLLAANAIRRSTYRPRGGDVRIRLHSGGFVTNSNPLSPARGPRAFLVLPRDVARHTVRSMVPASARPASVEMFKTDRWATLYSIK